MLQSKTTGRLYELESSDGTDWILRLVAGIKTKELVLVRDNLEPFPEWEHVGTFDSMLLFNSPEVVVTHDGEKMVSRFDFDRYLRRDRQKVGGLYRFRSLHNFQRVNVH